MEDHWIEDLRMFEAALEIESPWQILKWTFDQAEGRLDLFIGFQGAQTLPCSVCHTPGQPFYDIDVDDQVWRHLDFWQYKTFLHAPHPRVNCGVCGKVKYAQIPWTRYNRSFTLLFDRWVLQLVKEMPVKPASRIVREHDTRLWRIVHHYVDQALEKQDLSQVRHLAIDETSAKRGHHYVTVVLDSETRRIVFATEGKNQQAVADFAAHLSTHRGKPEPIEEYCSDMSAAFMSGMAQAFPKAKQTIDKFHVMKLLGNGLIQAAKRKARGYRTTRNLIAMIYLIGGKFDL